MKLILTALMILSSGVASASVYKLVNHIQFGEKKYSNSLIIENGKSGQISAVSDETKEGYKMAVVATPIKDKHNSVRLKYNLYQIKNGADKSFGNPELIVLPGQEASVEVGGKNNLPEYKISVLLEEAPKDN